MQNPKLGESMAISLITCLDYRVVASSVEALGDHTTETAKTIKETPQYKLPSDIQSVITDVSKLIYYNHNNAITALFSNNIEMIEYHFIIKEN